MECFRTGDCRRPFPTLRDALTRLDEGLEGIRDSRVLASQKLGVLMHTLELANRYQAIAEGLEECSSVIQTLQLDRYMADCALQRTRSQNPTSYRLFGQLKLF